MEVGDRVMPSPRELAREFLLTLLVLLMVLDHRIMVGMELITGNGDGGHREETRLELTREVR